MAAVHKMSTLVSAAILIVSLSAPMPCAAQSSGEECSFHRYHTVVIVGPLAYEEIVWSDPRYPSVALAERIEGDVRVEILVNRRGKVVKVCAYQGPEELREAAERAALKLKESDFEGKDVVPVRKIITRSKVRYLEGFVIFRFKSG